MTNIQQMKSSHSLTLLFFILIGPVQASPNDETNWLMETPASLFDIGMSRTSDLVKKELNKYKNHANKGLDAEFVLETSSYVEYDFKKDNIIIEWDITYSFEEIEAYFNKKKEVVTQESIEDVCRSMLKWLASNTYGQSDKFKKYGHYKLEDSFGHFGYSSRDKPKELYRNLASIITYKVLVGFYSDNPKTDKKLHSTLCTIGFDNPLSSTTPMFEILQ